MPISNINTSLNKTSYTFTQFIGKYIYRYQPKLANNKIKIQEQLEKAILYRSKTWSNKTIDCQARIYLKTARK